MVKNIIYFLISIFLPGFSLALHGYYRLAFLYLVLIGLFLTLSASLGYFFQPESFLIVIFLIFLVAVISSIHGLVRIRFGPEIYQGRLNRFIQSGYILLWLFLIIGLLFFRQTWLGLEFFSVQGNSMQPTLMSNDIVVAEVISNETRLQENDVVVFTYPKSTKVLIKRYVPIKENGVEDQTSLFVLGDNLDSSLDSRLMGPIPRDRIIGKVHWVLVNDGGLAFEKLLLKID